MKIVTIFKCQNGRIVVTEKGSKAEAEMLKRGKVCQSNDCWGEFMVVEDYHQDYDKMVKVEKNSFLYREVR